MLNAQLKAWLEQVNQQKLDLAANDVVADPAVVRSSLETMTAQFVSAGPSLPWVEDRTVDAQGKSVSVRLYDPAPERSKPVALFLHGGGHMAGSVAVYDPICRRIAEASGWLIVSVEYRLTPEHPYPQGLADCLHVARHVWPLLEAEHRLFTRRLALIGDSGGGALAATISASAQHDSLLNIDSQVLIYPSLDYTLDHASVRENGQGYLLEQARMAWYFDHYFQRYEDRHAASPLYMPITPNLPPTLVISAGYCPLRDEALAYVERLAASGVPHHHRHFADMIHAYLNLEALVPDACVQTYQEIGRFLSA
ncbi:lipase protein [Salinisphaera shabanensis E1L3A]|uniref:Lipase protein n=1 Tax=Salinisphaera shabanensis E1L3A TaxID=1033802 RepID=U2ES82_9GAMM|nr:alpha/beta hydrolase [Salinisphaera shabanensis]ERJ20847.1 lipase protein [Salinisphaera shabanensis E1L3A]